MRALEKGIKMIYTDGVHIVADSLEELHIYMQSIGIKRCWYEKAKRHPHYDIPKMAMRMVWYQISIKKIQLINPKELLLISKSLIK